MPTSPAASDPTRAAKAARFRQNVRRTHDCPTCGAPAGYYCKNDDGGRLDANHWARVELLTGQKFEDVNWTAAAVRRKKKRRQTMQRSWTS